MKSQFCLLSLGAFCRMIFEVEEKGRFHDPLLPAPSETNHFANNSNLVQNLGSVSSLPRISTFGEKHFQVDHPFTFFVWDYFKSYVIYMGRVMFPENISL